MRVLVAIALAGCQYNPQSAGTPNDGAGGDGSPDDGAATDTSATSCVDKWLAGNPISLSLPALVPNVSFGIDERNPWLNKDESFIYITREATNDTDVFFSQRTLSGFFNSPQSKGSLSSNTDDDDKCAMTSNELTAVVASKRGGTIGGFDLFEATRAVAGDTGFGGLSTTPYATINTTGDDRDPHLSDDGLRIYFVQGTPARVKIAERTTLGGVFGPGAELSNINDGGDTEDPTLTSDERVLVFTSARAGSKDLLFATRTDRNQDFGTPAQVPVVNDPAFEDVDAHLTPDGCRLYLASNRGGSFDIYLSEVQ